MILLKNCSFIVTQNDKREILKNKDVLVEGNKIIEIGSNLDKSGKVIDCKDKVLLPGLINTHTHLAMTLFRGYGDDMQLQEWLETKIWPLEAKLKENDIYWGSLLGCLEMIKSGTTCFNDMYYHPTKVAESVDESGVRGCLSAVLFDFFDKEKTKEQIKIAEKDLHELINKKNSRIIPFLGPHAIYTCSEELLAKTKELAKKYKVGIHIHASETRKEIYDSLKKYKKRPVEYLDNINFLGKEVLMAHGAWLTKGEVKILGKNNVKVSHCPISNMKLASGGVAPLPEMFENNVTVGLGTDGCASNNNLDMFEEMKIVALLHKAYRWDPTLIPAQKALDMATIDGARALNLENEIGSIEIGKKADLILVDLKSPHLTPTHNIVSNLVYSANGNDVDATIVNGKLLMENKILKTLDEKEILEKAQKTAEKLINK